MNINLRKYMNKKKENFLQVYKVQINQLFSVFYRFLASKLEMYEGFFFHNGVFFFLVYIFIFR